MHKATRIRKKSGLHTPVRQSIEAYANMLVVLYSGLLNTISLQLQPCTEVSNASNMLEIDTTLSMPDLGAHAYMHVSCIKK